MTASFPPASVPSLLPELLAALRCPASHLPLHGWNGDDDNGMLTSAEGERYPVQNGIPCLLPAALREAAAAMDDHEAAEKRREMAARDAQVGDYDRMLGLKLFTSAELPLSLRFLAPQKGHLVLEAGCGTGRMTEAFARQSRGLLCVDFSAESLRVARAKLPPDLRSKVLFVQADISRLPIASEVFDRVGSFGVYEHIPTNEARARALSELSRVLKSRENGGRLALSAYRWGAPQSWVSRREGHHDGGIYFVRFTQAELKAQVGAHLEVGGATEALLYYHLLWGRKRAASASA